MQQNNHHSQCILLALCVCALGRGLPEKVLGLAQRRGGVGSPPPLQPPKLSNTPRGHTAPVRPGKGKGKSDGWFPQPLTHNTRRVCTNESKNKLPMHSFCPTREWEREWYGVTTPNIFLGQGVILFPFGATPPLIGEAEEVHGCRRALGGL